MTMSAFTHVYCYPLFESGTKQVCEQSLYVEKMPGKDDNLLINEQLQRKEQEETENINYACTSAAVKWSKFLAKDSQILKFFPGA